VLAGRTGTDGDTIYPGRGGVPISVMSVPNRYMHSPVEVVSLSDLDAISTLCAAFAKRLNSRSTFDPFP
jgi:endoglucanase